MSLYTYEEHEDSALGKEPCKTDRESWVCPNMKRAEDDTSMTHEHYTCKMCGRWVTLDYEEMR